jgi:hypothetical protein
MVPTIPIFLHKVPWLLVRVHMHVCASSHALHAAHFRRRGVIVGACAHARCMRTLESGRNSLHGLEFRAEGLGSGILEKAVAGGCNEIRQRKNGRRV